MKMKTETNNNWIGAYSCVVRYVIASDGRLTVLYHAIDVGTLTTK